MQTIRHIALGATEGALIALTGFTWGPFFGAFFGAALLTLTLFALDGDR